LFLCGCAAKKPLHQIELDHYPITVLDYQGHPIKGAAVQIIRGHDYWPQSITDETGVAEVNLSDLRESCLLVVRCPNNNSLINVSYEYPPPDSGIVVLLPCNDHATEPIKVPYIPPFVAP
jgi:hypothetical protein